MLSAAATGSNSNSALVAGLVPEGASYKSGLYIATGDLDGDGAPEIVTSSQTGLGRIRAFDVVGGPTDYSITPFINTSTGLPFVLTPYTTKDKDMTGAVVAVGDINGDGRDEIVTAPGPGIAALVKIFDGSTGTFMRSFTAFEPTFKNGVSLALGDVDNTDGLNTDEIIVGAGANGSSQSEFSTASARKRASSRPTARRSRRRLKSRCASSTVLMRFLLPKAITAAADKFEPSSSIRASSPTPKSMRSWKPIPRLSPASCWDKGLCTRSANKNN